VSSCEPLSAPINGSVHTTGTGVGSVATYSCDHGYVFIGGPLVRVCTKTGQWSETAPTCVQAGNCISFLLC